MADLLTYNKLCRLNKRLYERLENLTLLIEHHELHGEDATRLKQDKIIIRMQLEINIEKLGVFIMTRNARDRFYKEQAVFEKALKRGEYYHELDEFSRHFHPYKPPAKRCYFRGAVRHS